MRNLSTILVSILISFLLVGTATAQWVQTNGPYGGGFILSVAFQDTLLITGSWGCGLFQSQNHGLQWDRSSLPNLGLHAWAVEAIAVNGSDIFAGTPDGVFISTDRTATWTHLDNGLSEAISTLAVSNTRVFAGTWTGHVYRSTDKGSSWSLVNNGFPDAPVRSLAIKGSDLFAATEGRGIFRTTDDGESWMAINNGLSDTLVHAIAASETNLYAGTWGSGVFRSTDDGASWMKVMSGNIYSLAVSGMNVYAGGHGVYRTTNNGTNWLPVESDSYMWVVYTLATSGDELMAGTRLGVFYSSGLGSTLSPINNGLPITDIPSMTVHGSYLFAGTQFNGVFRSSDNGESWSRVTNGPTSVSVWALHVAGSTLFAGTGSDIFRSDDDGTTWTEVVTVLGVYVFFSRDGTIYAGTGNGVYRSTDNGTTWEPRNNGITGLSIYSLAAFGTKLFVGTSDSVRVFSSSDEGVTWIPINNGLTRNHVYALAVCESTLYAGTGDGVFRLNVDGESWTRMWDYGVTALTVISQSIFAGTYAGIFRSSDDGITWTRVDTGLTSQWILSLTMTEHDLFAGTYSGSVWRRPIAEMISAVPSSSTELPRQFMLSQNYPNPFNPTTTMSYQLPTQSQVTLKIFDVLGREVATLVNGVEEPGYKSVTWDASKLSSSVYFYKLTAGSYIETKKLLLIR